MKSTDIRGGNYVMRRRDRSTFICVHWTDIKLLETWERDKYSKKPPLKPIPLTKEWIVKLGGFTYGNNIYSISEGIRFHALNSRIEVAVAGPGHDGCNIWDDEFKHIDSVHSLQNLYYSLYNEELTIK